MKLLAAVAPQVGHRIASIFFGLSFFLTSHIMPWDFRRLLVNFEQRSHFCAVEPNAVGKFL
jgi:hypothetical protein